VNLNRRELKFHIPLSLVGPISRFVEAYCDLDRYSMIAPDLFYLINTLYLDSDEMVLLTRRRSGRTRRFTLRIRNYGENPGFPAFLEIKSRVDQWVHKRRVMIERPETFQFISEGLSTPDNPEVNHPVVQAACYHILDLGLRPKVMSRYRRKAYFGKIEPYARVTFDRGLQCYPEDRYNMHADPARFRNYDHQNNFLGAQNNVILELKCEARVPAWMSELIRIFELRHHHFSKFDASYVGSRELLSDDAVRESAWA